MNRAEKKSKKQTILKATTKQQTAKGKQQAAKQRTTKTKENEQEIKMTPKKKHTANSKQQSPKSHQGTRPSKNTTKNKAHGKYQKTRTKRGKHFIETK